MNLSKRSEDTELFSGTIVKENKMNLSKRSEDTELFSGTIVKENTEIASKKRKSIEDEDDKMELVNTEKNCNDNVSSLLFSEVSSKENINKKSRYISKKTINDLLEKYKNKCANNPDNQIIKDYYCPMWLLYNGDFDISGYQIDHIDEFSITGDNSVDNLQPLCPSCHTVKTKKFMKNKCNFTTTEINNGRCIMEID